MKGQKPPVILFEKERGRSLYTGHNDDVNFLRLIGASLEDTSIGIIILDDQEKIVAFNKSQERNSRISREKVLNRKFLEVFPKLKKVEIINDSYSTLIANQVPFDVVVDGYTPQYYNVKTIFRMRGNSLGNGLGYILLCEIKRDLFIAKRKLEAKIGELRNARNFLSKLIDASPSGFISITKERKVRSCNLQAGILFGYKRASIWGKNVSILFPNRELKRIEEAINSLIYLNHSKHNFRTFGLKSNQEEFLIDLHIIRVLDIEAEIAILLLIRDVSEEERLRKNLMLSEKMALIGKTMGQFAHQLNNPIVGLINLTEVLYNNMSPNDKNFDLIKTIKEAGAECRNIIYNLLNVYKVPSEVQEIHIDRLLQGCVCILSKQDRLDGIKVKAKYAENIPPIRTNEVQLTQALLNIMNNAIEAMPNGGVMEINTRLIKPRAGNRHILVRLGDTGIGIPDKYRSKIFDPLFSTKNKGTGLGLSFTYTVIKDLRGDIRIRKRTGKGTIFEISLPIE